jgi:2'-5' RNA ligase
MIRLFVGLALPPDCRERLARTQGGVPGARWIAPENFHITLRFIGEVPEPDAEAIAASLDTLVHPPVAVRVAGLSFGGDSHRARTLWAEVERTPELAELQKRVESLVVASECCAPETRRYRPHVTLARFSGVRPERLQEFLSENALVACAPFVADAVVLYSSQLSRNGSKYVEEVRFPLAAGNPSA